MTFIDRRHGASYFEQRFRNRVYEVVIRALEKACEENNLKRKDIAERSNKKESQISRWLAGPGNWTLDTISNLLFAIDAELEFEVVKFKDKVRKNEFHDLNEPSREIEKLPAAQLPKTSGTKKVELELL